MQATLLQKIEELTLYAIGQHERAEQLETQLVQKDAVLADVLARLAALEAQATK